MVEKHGTDGVHAHRIVLCVVCNSAILEAHSHNAWPVKDGRCCGDCNSLVVVPARIRQHADREKDDG